MAPKKPAKTAKTTVKKPVVKVAAKPAAKPVAKTVSKPAVKAKAPAKVVAKAPAKTAAKSVSKAYDPATTAVIVGYVRTPFTPAGKGALARTRADDMAAAAVMELVKRTKVKTADVSDVIFGCAFPEGEQGFNVARLISFLAKLPHSVAAVTVNRFCGSSMQAIHMAAGNIALGAGEVFICGGVESMSRVPMTGFNPMPNPGLAKDFLPAYMGMGETAENLADLYKIDRKTQEKFAVASHAKAAKAQAEGKLKPEIVAVGGVSEDGCIRAETTPETLAGLKTAFKEKGSVTAGTASPLTDGAVAVLVTSLAYAQKHGLKPMARVVSIAVTGCHPATMGLGPVASTKLALLRAGLKLEDMDVIELNEAFAVQGLSVLKELGVKMDDPRLNMHGGAIALGHPLGASGARITGKAAALLQETGGRYALATMCIGGGQGIATILERM